jgi:hypothetical protein
MSYRNAVSSASLRVIVVPKRYPYFEQQLKALQVLRKAGVTEPD